MLSEKGLPCVYALSADCKMSYCNLPIWVRFFFPSAWSAEPCSSGGLDEEKRPRIQVSCKRGRARVYVCSCRDMIGSTGDVFSFTICLSTKAPREKMPQACTLLPIIACYCSGISSKSDFLATQNLFELIACFAAFLFFPPFSFCGNLCLIVFKKKCINCYK